MKIKLINKSLNNQINFQIKLMFWLNNAILLTQIVIILNKDKCQELLKIFIGHFPHKCTIKNK